MTNTDTAVEYINSKPRMIFPAAWKIFIVTWVARRLGVRVTVGHITST